MPPRYHSTVFALCLCLGLGLAGVAGATAQCILANPSFELAGSGGPVFSGWNQFGAVGWTPLASHGHRAARVTGTDTGNWDLSGFWQSQDCVPGEQWLVTGQVSHPAGRPLVGGNLALVNIEWRDADARLLSHDSFPVATPDTPPDEYLPFSRLSSPAPAGTVSARILVGNLQGPGEPVSDACFDQITFVSQKAPTIDVRQWNDFPGGRTISFGGQTWRVKGTGYFGPGPNVFSDDAECIWVDADHQLHLTVTSRNGTWTSTEVATDLALGYGDYVMTTRGPLDALDPQVVLGLFLWEYGTCWDDGYTSWNAYNEIDIEYSRWANPANDLGQFVAQPYDWPGNLRRFDLTIGPDELVSHAMRWLPDRVEYRVWRGGPGTESAASLVQQWTYAGPHLPRPEQPRLHLNLWRLAGTPAAGQEVVFTNFSFVPEGAVSAVGEYPPVPRSGASAGWLYPARPNPFNPRTSLAFALARGGPVELKIFDLYGHLLNTLVDESLAVGEYRQSWDGRDSADRPVASGVYFLLLSGVDFQESQRLILLK